MNEHKGWWGGLTAGLNFLFDDIGSFHARADGTAYSRPMTTISCKDCGSERRGVPKNTLYCKKCRVLRDVVFWQTGRARTCQAGNCKAKFAPLSRNDYYCSTCDPGLPAYAGPCGLGPARNNKPHEGSPTYTQIPICAVCMRSPEQRKNLIGALGNGQDARRKANDWSAP